MIVANFRRRRWAVLTVVLLGVACSQPPAVRSARFIDAGKKLMQQKDPTRALLQFRNAIQASPKEPEGYYQLSLAYLALGDIHNGVAALQKTLDINPKHAGAQVQMARLMMSVNDPGMLKDARSRLESVVEGAPNDPFALHALALTDLRLGDTQDATMHLDRAIQAAPQELFLVATLAQAKLQQNDVKGAEDDLKKACERSPRSADAQVLLGRFYGAQRKWPEAAQHFQQALVLDPNHAPALLSLAKEQYLVGKPADAEQTFKRLSTLSGSDLNHYYGLFLFNQGRKDEAVRELERLWRQDPENRLARTRLLAAYQTAGRLPEAKKLLQSVLKKNPKDLDALLESAEISTTEGAYADAEAKLSEVLHFKPDSGELHYSLAKFYQVSGRPGQQRQELYEALRLNPYLLPARLDLAQVLVQSNSAKAALEIVDAVPNAQRSEVQTMRNWVLWSLGDTQQMRQGVDAGLARNRTSDLLIQDGILKLKQGNPGGARAALTEALKINPADLRALGALQQSYVAEKRSDLAVQKVKEYAATQSGSAPVQEFTGLLLWANGDRQRAREAFANAKAADPHFENADLSMVQLDVLEKKWDSAQKTLGNVLQQNPRNTRARLWMAHLSAMHGNYAAALDGYRKVIDAEPDNPDALNNMAYLMSTSPNQTDEALKYAQKAQEHSPDDPNIADTVGWILYQKGLYPSAVQQLRRAASKDSNVVWKYHLAMAYAKAGDRTQGLATLQAALKKDPNVPEAAQAKQLLGTK